MTKRSPKCEEWWLQKSSKPEYLLVAASVEQKRSTSPACVIYKISFIYSKEHGQVVALKKKNKPFKKILFISAVTWL